MIRFRCKKCGKKLKADDEIIGRKVKCTRCDKVARVPPTDNLAKSTPAESPSAADPTPESSGEFSFSWEDPKSTAEPADSGEFVPPTVMGDDEFGDAIDGLSWNGDGAALGSESAGVVLPAVDAQSSEFAIKVKVKADGEKESSDSFEPRFKKAQRQSLSRRSIIIGILSLLLGAGGIGATVMVVRYLNPGQTFSAEFEKKALVLDYRRAVLQIEKSSRFLKIASQPSQSGANAATDDARRLSESQVNNLLDRVNDMTENSTVLVDASKLFDEDNDTAARALLIQSAKVLDDQRADIDQKTRAFK